MFTKKSIYLIIAMIIALLVIVLYLFNPGQSSNRSHNADQPPSISLEALFNASDVKQGLQQAAMSNNVEQIEEWQEQLLHVAEVAGYSESELAFLQDDRGIDYLRFRGRRFAFNEAIELAYINGEPAMAIIAKHPEATDLFDEVEQLFSARDEFIDALAAQIQAQSNTDLSAAAARQEALRQWQLRVQEQD